MSTYLDPATALTLARTSRAMEIRAAEQYHLTHTRPERRRHGQPWRLPWHLGWHRPAIA